MTTDTVPLGEVAEFIRGITFKPADVVEPGADGSVVCLRTKNVQSQVDLEDLLALPSRFVKRENQYLQPGDVLISSANSWNLVGKCSWIPELPWPASFGGFVTALRPRDDRVDRRYLYHWFNLGPTQKLLRSFGRKTTNISNLNLDRCRDMDLPLPPIAEQRRIAAVLDAAGALRVKRRQAIAKLSALREAIFLDMFGDGINGQQSWPSIELGGLVQESRLGLVRAARDLDSQLPWPYIRMNAIGATGELDLGALRRTYASEAELQSHTLLPGDLVFNTRNTRQLVGKTAIFRGPGTYLFNNNILRLRFTHDADSEYVNAALRTPALQHELEARKSGTTSVVAIYYKSLSTLPLPLPPIELQQTFSRRVQAVVRESERLRQAAVNLDSLFASLQQRAFRGEL